MLNQVSIVGEHDYHRTTSNVAKRRRSAWRVTLSSGSAQADSLGTEYNLRLYDMLTWTHGRNLIKIGAGTPHIDRRAYDDNTNALGTYTFGPTLASDGTVLQSALAELRRTTCPRDSAKTPATCTSSITSRRWARLFRTSSR